MYVHNSVTCSYIGGLTRHKIKDLVSLQGHSIYYYMITNGKKFDSELFGSSL